MEQVLLTGVRQGWLQAPLAVPEVARPILAVKRKPELRLPDQSRPVNRFRALLNFAVAYQVGVDDKGKPIMTYVEQAAPFPDTQDKFSDRVDQRLGVCPVLSSYAVARCFRSGGRS
jgi:hypothetical protein